MISKYDMYMVAVADEEGIPTISLPEFIFTGLLSYRSNAFTKVTRAKKMSRKLPIDLNNGAINLTRLSHYRAYADEDSGEYVSILDGKVLDQVNRIARHIIGIKVGSGSWIVAIRTSYEILPKHEVARSPKYDLQYITRVHYSGFTYSEADILDKLPVSTIMQSAVAHVDTANIKEAHRRTINICDSTTTRRSNPLLDLGELAQELPANVRMAIEVLLFRRSLGIQTSARWNLIVDELSRDELILYLILVGNEDDIEVTLAA